MQEENNYNNDDKWLAIANCMGPLSNEPRL